MINYIELASASVAERYPNIVYAKPRLMDLPPGAILGTWAYSLPGQMRFILAREFEVAPGVLPSDLARAWIKDQYKLPIRRRKEQLVRGYNVPLMAIRGKHGQCSYVDIRAAYLQVLRLGYDVDYQHGEYLGAEPREVPPEIQSAKLAYSIAVTMAGTVISDIEIMGHQGIFHHKPMNMFSNPCLYNLANDTLCAIGSELLTVLKGHVFYANTDGVIVEDGYEGFAMEIIASWGFESRIAKRDGLLLQGDTEVRGVASYQIGEYKTKRFDHNPDDFCSHLMPRDERGWLKARWVKWAARLIK